MKEVDGATGGLPQELELAERITSLLDDRFRIPFTDIRFGIDPVLGLIPGAGDTVSAIISLLMVIAFVRHGIPARLVGLMLLNILVDTVVGSVPVFGNIFDVVFKANRRNLKLARAFFISQQE